jgi:hypothetical protein
LDASKGGIPKTRVSKNREAFFNYDRKKGYAERVRLREWLEEKITDLDIDEIDAIIVNVKERTWS